MGHDLIRLCNMQFYGRHGVNPEEQVLGQRFEVDVDLRTDTRPAALQDDLHQTINYAQVYKIVKRIVEDERFDLIETLAETIAMQIGQQCTPESVRVCVRKPHAPLKGVLDYVAVEIERTKALWPSSTSA
ncbi:MAG: dihydroneopterin aldolase [Candidatus Tectomicrobia bacterium]|uniref:7,8-dihydroneopterin aldolase n=1 Tax=Tectimicrobiota bacterium TaxID=2528274 RepID=A0A937W3E5_UNCTE|nr:dihydroneopterin aldolase [Candidatus Tectomicrobia bacterium]